MSTLHSFLSRWPQSVAGVVFTVTAAIGAWACGRSGLEEDLVGISGATGSSGTSEMSGAQTSGGTGSAGSATGTAGTVTGAAGVVTGTTGVVTGAAGAVAPPTACSSTCQGCCDSNGQCEAGFLDDQCGEIGNSCVNCDGLSPPSTCDTNSMPRVCTTQQTRCPAPYAGCRAGITAAMPIREAVCSPQDLKEATAACLGGAQTPGCQSFFQGEQMQNPACSTCLRPFDFDFTEFSGLIACLSPFVDPMCSVTLGCLNDCEDQSCNACPDVASLQQCRTQVAQTACQTFTANSTCVESGLVNGGLFCEPQTQNQFGDWLGSVGSFYCAQ